MSNATSTLNTCPIGFGGFKNNSWFIGVQRWKTSPVYVSGWIWNRDKAAIINAIHWIKTLKTMITNTIVSFLYCLLIKRIALYLSIAATTRDSWVKMPLKDMMSGIVIHNGLESSSAWKSTRYLKGIARHPIRSTNANQETTSFAVWSRVALQKTTSTKVLPVNPMVPAKVNQVIYKACDP